jgi:predicted small secreted protein
MNLLTLTILALTSLSLTACGTLNGAGQDIENAGESIQDAAK